MLMFRAVLNWGRQLSVLDAPYRQDSIDRWQARAWTIRHAEVCL